MHLVRRFDHRQFGPDSLAAAKADAGLAVTVCLPCRDEVATAPAIVECLRAGLVPAGLVDEVLVVDDSSSDGTAEAAGEAGARVIAAGTGPWGPGKGGAMWQGLQAAVGDIVVYCDADVENFSPHFVTGLLGPLLADPGVGVVKGFYDRPLAGVAGEGGRVTELMARPAISLLFPHLSSVVQPLAGECAGRRSVIERVPFTHGYGVELGLLIDVAARFGLDSIAQVDLGVRVHRNRPLAELSAQATAVLRAALDRAGVTDGSDWSALMRPGGEPSPVATGVHPPVAELDGYDRRSA